MQETFIATLNQMISFFVIMLIGYIIKKTNSVNDKFDNAASQLQSNVIMPALTFQTFYNNFKVENLKANAVIFVVGLITITISHLLAIQLAKPFGGRDRYQRNIYTYSFSTGNYGYMGYAVIGAVFGDSALASMMVFCIPFSMFVYSIGTAILNPNNPKISLKAFKKIPVFYAMIIGAVMGLVNIPLPKVILSTAGSIGNCMGPIAMLIAGFIIAKYNLKELFTMGKVYIASLLRLVVIPTIAALIFMAFKFDKSIMIGLMGTMATPLGLNTIVFPAAYGGDTKTGASMALISNVLGIITIPIMFAIFI